MNLKLYEKISSVHGPSGSEHKLKEILRESLKDADNILEDNLGGIFGVYNGKENEPKIMITAHMDEIGAIITDITKDGFMKITNIGGVNAEALVSANVNVETKNGSLIKGVISSVPPHISKDTKFTIEDLTLDVGATSSDEVREMGIEIGSFVSPISQFYVTENKKRIVNKALDDRMGLSIVLELIEEIKMINHDSTIILGGTVQEEVGLRGARVATPLVNPDLFITIDVSPMADYLGKANEGALGNGFLLRYYDPGCIMPKNLKDYFIKLAEDNEIKYQMFRSRGGTDAGAAQYSGIGTLATTLGIPGRYIHSPASMVDLDDVSECKKMAICIMKDFNRDKLNKILGKN